MNKNRKLAKSQEDKRITYTFTCNFFFKGSNEIPSGYFMKLKLKKLNNNVP